MLTPFNQNWRTSTLPFSLALANTVNTGVSFSTPSGAIANSQRWASRGFQGYGPRIQYGPGAGLDGLGCGCGGGDGCGCGGGGGSSFLLCAAVAAAAVYFLGSGGTRWMS